MRVSGTRKKATVILLFSVLWTNGFLSDQSVVLANETIKVFVNDKRVAFGNQPVREQGRALVPLRETFEALNADVTWDAAQQKITAVNGDRRIVITLGSAYAFSNGKTLALDVPPKVVEGSTYVPLRFVSEAFGALVNWDSSTSTIKITHDYAYDRKTIAQIATMGTSIFLIESYDDRNELSGTGSGFLVDDFGTVVTNYHVIRDAKTLRLLDTRQMAYNVAQVLYTDPVRDLALLTVNEPMNLSKLALGDSDALQIGDDIVAIGSPKGLQNTVSNGIVSGFRNFDGQALVQITAPITFGSSGGALFDMYGNVVGVTSSGIDAHGNLNFAIPINDVKKAISTTFRQTSKAIRNRYASLPQLSATQSFTFFSNGKYVGDMSKELPHGNGSTVWEDGQRYVGQYVDGKRHGEGLYAWHDGSTYHGEWTQDKRTGKGVFRWPNGDVYAGFFIDGERTGYGILAYGDSSQYEGAFVKGKYHGEGKKTWYENGKKVELRISFVDGLPHGIGTLIAQTTPYEVNYIKGVLLEKVLKTND